MRLWLAFLLSAVTAAADTVEAFGFRWTVQNAADWAVEGGMLRLLVPGEPPPGLPRRPQKYALAETAPFRKVTLEAEVRRNGRSLVLIYAWQDEAHFNYAHISSDPAEKVHVHNGMFHVFGGERVRISPLDGPPSLPTRDWTPVRLIFDGDSGRCIVEVNGRRNPSLEAVDLSLRYGRVGLGSFDETGDFRNVRIRGQTRQPSGIGRR
ncbi:MAG: hypothetical protein K6T61_13545 [Bryobacteraceae bacterium]|nr:hypothetical protein [Bryobacteraceae bacterium]